MMLVNEMKSHLFGIMNDAKKQVHIDAIHDSARCEKT